MITNRLLSNFVLFFVLCLQSHTSAENSGHVESIAENRPSADTSQREMCASAYSPIYDLNGKLVYTMVTYHHVTSTGTLGKNVSMIPGVFILIATPKPLSQSKALKEARTAPLRLYGKQYLLGTPLKVEMFSNDGNTSASGIFGQSEGEITLRRPNESDQTLKVGVTTVFGITKHLFNSNICIPFDQNTPQ